MTYTCTCLEHWKVTCHEDHAKYDGLNISITGPNIEHMLSRMYPRDVSRGRVKACQAVISEHFFSSGNNRELHDRASTRRCKKYSSHIIPASPTITTVADRERHAMKLAKYTILDMIDDKIGEIKYALDFVDHFKRIKKNICYDAPQLWEDSGFKTWEEFRSNRNKYHIENRIHPTDDFPLAGFSLSDPGAITIIEDDFIDLLHILRHKNLQAMRAEYVSSVFFAVETADARLHYVLGSYRILEEFDRQRQEEYRKRQEFHKKRTDKAKEVKRKKQDKVATDILQEFNKLYGHSKFPSISRNGIFNKIREARPDEDDTYLWSINTIRNALNKYHKEGKITLPPLKKLAKR